MEEKELPSAEVVVEQATVTRIEKGAPLFDCLCDMGRALRQDIDGESGADWVPYLQQVADEPAPYGVYVLHDGNTIMAAGVMTADQHGAGAHHGLEGPWLGAGHVFRPWRNLRLHQRLVEGRLEAAVDAGARAVNVAVNESNTVSQRSMIRAGFSEACRGPSLWNGAPTIFFTWRNTVSTQTSTYQMIRQIAAASPVRGREGFNW